MTATTSSGAITAAPGQTKDARGGGPGAPVRSRAARLTSHDPEAFGIPNGREEEWRFTPLARIDGLLEAIDDPIVPVYEVQAPDGVAVTTVAAADASIGRVIEPADRISALALAGITNATVVRIGPDQTLSEPVIVTVDVPAGRGYGHLMIEAAAFSTATVVIDHRGAGTLAANTEIRLDDGAALTLVSVQDADRSAVHVEAQAAVVGRDARLRSIVFTTGGDLVRLTPSVRFTGPGGEADLLGLFFTSAGQHHEHQLFIDHEAPYCRSRVNYKGALQGAEAHSVWVGDVLVGAAANDTDSYELNRNLLLTDGARADSVPNLEIETGDVTDAGHASATGRFDDEQLFYCMARGIPAAEARRLVVRGFFAELLDHVEHAPLRDRLIGRIDALLREGESYVAAGGSNG